LWSRIDRAFSGISSALPRHAIGILTEADRYWMMTRYCAWCLSTKVGDPADSSPVSAANTHLPTALMLPEIFPSIQLSAAPLHSWTSFVAQAEKQPMVDQARVL